MEIVSSAALEWITHNMPRTVREVGRLPSLTGMRLASSTHLDTKMLPLFLGLAEAGCELFVTTCNPQTVRDSVVATLKQRGIRAEAAKGMSRGELNRVLGRIMEWGPTHLCEMGADLSAARQSIPGATAGAGAAVSEIFAGLEATGSGINRLREMELPYPVFNWDDLPVKEGLHNRFMVGLSTWTAFFTRTGLSLHEKRVLILGFGSVGRGVADVARAFGGMVTVVEVDAARRTEAAYRGWQVAGLPEALSKADIVVTATGHPDVLGESELEALPDGAVIVNVGHTEDEIDRRSLLRVDEPVPFLTRYRLATKELFLFADGAMANLTAGEGDSLNAFDVTLAVLTRAIGFLARFGPSGRPGGEADASQIDLGTYGPGIHMLPEEIWRSALET